MFLNMDDGEVSKDGPLPMKTTEQWLNEGNTCNIFFKIIINII